MKKLLCLLLCLCVLPSALSETLRDGRDTRTQNLPKRFAVYEAEEGVSPTTGLKLSDRAAIAGEGFAGLAITGRYQPMLVQIDNTNGGAGDIAPWGVYYADIVYEFPLHASGATRLSALFSDLMPTSVGPMRSARVGAVWTRAEWDAGFMYYGQQTLKGSSVPDELNRTGAKFGEVRFNGTDSDTKPWKQYYSRRKNLVAPHNAQGNAAAISTLIPETHVARPHVLPFTNVQATGGDRAETITVYWGSPTIEYTLVWDEPSKGYLRYCHHKDGSLELWVDQDRGEPIVFQNVIIQFTQTTYRGGSSAPVTTVTGRGNAEYFQSGEHFEGIWSRPQMTDQTLYYLANRKRLQFQKGRTLIVMLPVQKQVGWE
ncbi:MAG: DUF3048 domain-containing protein [Clostridia bacterium]|nr:DUF3048 domain-containing protein [Clostridia bacterium]